MTTVAIIQARMTSTRLPGKVLMPAAGRPLLSIMLERVARARRIDRIVVATTTNATDDPVAALVSSEGHGVFRGSEADVLSRFHGAAREAGADVAVRLTGDCPIHDPEVIDAMVALFQDSEPGWDYVTNAIPRSYPAGLDTEVMSVAALDTASREATEGYEREHVTPFLYKHPERFRLKSVVMEPNRARERWTLDERADYELIRRIVEALLPENPAFGWRDVVDLLDAHPDWRAINGSVRDNPRIVDEVVFG